MKIYIFIFLVLPISLIAQVGINTVTPDASSELDIVSTDKGILLPIVTTAEMNGILSPATGLIVYNSTEMAYYYFNGSIWAKIGTVGKALRDADNDTYIQVEEAADEDIIRVDIGNNFGATYENKVTISTAETVIEGDYTIPNGNTLRLGATPFVLPSSAGNKGTVMATNGTGNWSWMEAHGGLGIASGVQTLYFAETTSFLAISNNTYYTPVIPFSSITVDTIEIYIGTIVGTPSLKFAIFNALGNKVAETNAATPGTAGIYQKDLVSPYTLESAKMYYFAVTDVNNTTTTILVNNQSANPFNLSDNTSKLVNPTMGTPSTNVNCVWIAVH